VADDEWRAAERRFEADPGDQEALARAIAGRRRAGLEVPLALLDAVRRPARSFTTSLKAHVNGVSPDGRLFCFGRTNVAGAASTVTLPEHRELVLEPEPKAPLPDVVAAAREGDAQGLLLQSAGKQVPALPGHELAKATHLERLDLLGWRVEAADVEPLRALPDLWSLDLRSCDVAPGTSAAIAALPALARLRLRYLISRRGALPDLAPLADARGLGGLELWSVPLDGRQAAALASNRALRALRLMRSSIDAAGVTALAGSGLEALGIDDVTAPGLLEALPRLERLTAIELVSLRGAPVDDAAAKLLAATGRLRSVELHAEPLGPAGVAALAGLPDLEELALRGSARLRAAHLAPLAGCARLTRLSLAQADGLEDAALAHLTGLSRLEALDLTGCSGLGDAGVATLAGLPRLERLSLTRTHVGPDGLRSLVGAPALRELHLRGCPLASDATLAALAGSRTLRLLSVSSNQVTPKGLLALAGVASLTDVVLGNCDKTVWSKTALRPFVRARPDVRLRMELREYNLPLLAGWPGAAG